MTEIEKYRGELPKVPETNEANPLKLLRLDSEAAYFRDAQGQDWYFDFGQNLWREGNIYDAYPMRLQASTPLTPEKTVFTNTEDAAINTLKVTLRDKVQWWKRTMTDYQPKDSEAEKDLWAFADITEYTEQIIALLQQMEKASEEQRVRLRKQVSELFEKINQREK